jgi:hypothetical protein
VRKITVLKPSVTQEDIEKVLKHKDFPRRPFIVLAKGLGLTYTKSTDPLSDIKSMRKFIRCNQAKLEEIVGFRTGCNQHLAPELWKLIEMSPYVSDEIITRPEADQASRAIDSWLSRKAWSFMRTLQTLPPTLTKAVTINMKINQPLSFFKVIGWLTKMQQNAHLANRFSDPRL